MNSTRRGNQLELKAQRIITRMGYMVAADAKRRPVWAKGRVVANNGGIDLVGGAIDFIAIQPFEPTLFIQVTTMSGASLRRKKLRAIQHFDPIFHMVQLWAWDETSGHFRVYRRKDNYLDAGWTIAYGDTEWPWLAKKETAVQKTLVNF